jgi:DNA-directed RNA polymerase subunit RPC12/RpoP
MNHCLKCHSDKVHPSRSRSKWDKWRRRITGKRPYRCPHCGWRGWAPDSGPHFSADEIASSSRAIAPDPPNLKETALAPDNRRVREIDLADLDSAILIQKPRDRLREN